jgi:hypothetical protein
VNISLPSLDWRHEGRVFILLFAAFALAWVLPVEAERFQNALVEGFALLKWYTQEHVVLCLLPAFVIAGAIAVFVNQDAVMRYLGPSASKPVAMSVASVSGTILAVCSCTVLPLFGGIYRRGAGLGPAIAFLYSGPAINVLAVVLTARVLGVEMGVARAVGAIGFAVVIGTLMHVVFQREERARAEHAKGLAATGVESPTSPGESVALFALLIAVLVFANWAPAEGEATWTSIGVYKWWLTAGAAAGLALFLVIRRHWSPVWMSVTAAAVLTLSLMLPSHPEVAFAAGLTGLMAQALFRPQDGQEWLEQSWDFAKQILPLLLLGVMAAGFFLGRPGSEGVIPAGWVAAAVGGNGVLANFAASLLGSLMYFATLTEVPIVQGLLGAGMGKGPALALLLAGPAVSLPNLLAIRALLGTEKTLVYAGLVVVMATISGIIYGNLFG